MTLIPAIWTPTSPIPCDAARARSLVVDDGNATQLAILRKQQQHDDEVGDREPRWNRCANFAV
jgi:hypothetical protein